MTEAVYRETRAEGREERPHDGPANFSNIAPKLSRGYLLLAHQSLTGPGYAFPKGALPALGATRVDPMRALRLE